jgi:hypothetical protein
LGSAALLHSHDTQEPGNHIKVALKIAMTSLIRAVSKNIPGGTLPFSGHDAVQGSGN